MEFMKLKAGFRFKFRFKALPGAWEQLLMSCDCCNGELCEI